jgi:hypothetical protein
MLQVSRVQEIINEVNCKRGKIEKNKSRRVGQWQIAVVNIANGSG